MSAPMRNAQRGRRHGHDRVAFLRWHLRWAWVRLGWREMVAIAAIGFAIGLELCVNRPLRQELVALQARPAPSNTAPARPLKCLISS